MKEEILIVEDDVDISGLLKRILEDAGYETKQAYSCLLYTSRQSVCGVMDSGEGKVRITLVPCPSAE